MAATATKGRAKPPARRAAPTPTTIEDASPSLLAKLAGEVRVVAAWIVGIGACVAMVWMVVDKVGEWRSASDASTAKLVMVERQLGEVTTLLTAMRETQATFLPRLVAVEGLRAEVGQLSTRMQTSETKIETATSSRNQQYEGLRDRVRVVEQADVQQADRAAQLTTTLGAIATRIEDMLRRMENIERRLDRSLFLPSPGTPPAHRNGAEPEAPAVWRLPHVGA